MNPEVEHLDYQLRLRPRPSLGRRVIFAFAVLSLLPMVITGLAASDGLFNSHSDYVFGPCAMLFGLTWIFPAISLTLRWKARASPLTAALMASERIISPAAQSDDEVRQHAMPIPPIASQENGFGDPRILFYMSVLCSRSHHLAKLGTASFAAAVLQLPWIMLMAAVFMRFDGGDTAFRICVLLPSVIAIVVGCVAMAMPATDHRRALAGIFLGVCFILFAFAMAVGA